MPSRSIEYRILTHVTKAEDRRVVADLLDQFRDALLEECARVADGGRAPGVAVAIRRRMRTKGEPR